MSCEAPLGRVLAVGRLVGIDVAAASAKDKGAIRVIDVADGEMGPDKLAFDTLVDAVGCGTGIRFAIGSALVGNAFAVVAAHRPLLVGWLYGHGMIFLL